MPMCDIYIPEGAFETEVEQQLVARISNVLVEHEIRRMADLMNDCEAVKVSSERAHSIAWMFVHRTDTYVAGRPINVPYYKFVVTIPQGMIDEHFAPAIDRDIYAAVKEAEAGRFPHLSQRIWTHIHELKDGHWGSGDRPIPVETLVEFVAPGWGTHAKARFEKQKLEEARELIARARW